MKKHIAIFALLALLALAFSFIFMVPENAGEYAMILYLPSLVLAMLFVFLIFKFRK
jgi:NADH:ubiquinone oxidoreductase subunit 6 (subunit J)